MNSSPPAFAPLPLRRRSVIEVFDTAIKLYRRYFGPLIAWSAIAALSWLISMVVPFAYFLVAPLVYGSVACAVACAVRGQTMSFQQAWNFTKPRYGALLGAIVVSTLILMAVGLALMVPFFMLFGVSAALIGSAAAVGIIGTILFLVLASVAGALLYAWSTLVPIVACLEDEHRGLSAIGRATSLMSGEWRRVLGASVLVGLACLISFAIVGGGMAMLGELAGFFDADNMSEEGIFALIGSASVMMGVLSMAWMPAVTLVIAVLYLDLRTRKEALDIEWTNYATSVEEAPTPGSVPGLAAPFDGAAAPLPPTTVGVTTFASGATTPNTTAPNVTPIQSELNNSPQNRIVPNGAGTEPNAAPVIPEVQTGQPVAAQDATFVSAAPPEANSTFVAPTHVPNNTAPVVEAQVEPPVEAQTTTTSSFGSSFAPPPFEISSTEPTVSAASFDSTTTSETTSSPSDSSSSSDSS